MKTILESLGFINEEGYSTKKSSSDPFKRKKIKISYETAIHVQKPLQEILNEDDSLDYQPKEASKSKFDIKRKFQIQELSQTEITSTKKSKTIETHIAVDNDSQPLMEPLKTIKQKISQFKQKNGLELEKTESKKQMSKSSDKETMISSEKWLDFISNVKVGNVKNGEAKKKKQAESTERVFPFMSSLNPPQDSFNGITPIVAIDCEMVMVEGNRHEVARISIVNYHNHVLFDEFIKPKGKITNYLTWVSGITYKKICNKETIDYHKAKLLKILQGRKIVGHTLRSDFQALHELELFVADKDVRDISKCRFLNPDGKVMSLKRMTEHFLSLDIQPENQSHDSVEDARAAMALFRKFESKWELEIKSQNYQLIKNSILEAKSSINSGDKKVRNAEVLVYE